MLVLSMKPLNKDGVEEVVITTPSGEEIVLVFCGPKPKNADEVKMGFVASEGVSIARRPVRRETLQGVVSEMVAEPVRESIVPTPVPRGDSRCRAINVIVPEGEEGYVQ